MTPLPRESGPEAGRELDALVAEKVMGWRWMRSNYNYAAPRPVFVFLQPPSVGGLTWSPALASDTRSKGYCGVPAYSTSIADAWLVVGAMLKRGFALTLAHEDFEKPWMAEFADTASAKTFAREALTVEHAICLAALAVPPTPGGRDNG